MAVGCVVAKPLLMSREHQRATISPLPGGEWVPGVFFEVMAAAMARCCW